MNELLLGARLLFAGGRSGWLRAAMTALGVGIGVALLLLAAALPTALQERAARTQGRWEAAPQDQSITQTVLVKDANTEFRGRPIRGALLRAEGPAAPVPPGLTRVPADGELVVSPALRNLLESPAGALLAPRLGGARIVATIGNQGLSGPGELAYYRGSDTLTAPYADRVAGFGNFTSEQPMSPMIVLLAVLGLVVLLLPVTVFLGAAVRFGGDARDRRLAALRLVGADAGMIRRIVIGEAMISAALGMVIGFVLFAVGRQLTPLVTVADISVFAADIRPNPGLVLAIVTLVAVLTVTVALVALRGIVVEPLSVTRRAVPVRRRLWWRLALPLAGLGLLYPLVNGFHPLQADWLYYRAALAASLLLVGVVTLLPWLIDQTVRRLRGGPVFWQLAIRRLQVDGATSARLVSGMAVAVAGTIGLQMLFTSVQDQFTIQTGLPDSQNVAYVEMGQTTDGTAMFKALATVRGQVSGAGVQLVRARVRGAINPVADDQSGVDPRDALLMIGDCGALTYLFGVDRCAPGDVFLPAHTVAQPGAHLSVGTTRSAWAIPSKARRWTPSGHGHQAAEGILVTPEAIDTSRLGPRGLTYEATIDWNTPDAMEYLRNAAATVDPAASVFEPKAHYADRDFTNVRRGLYVGAVVSLLLIGLSLLVAVLEHLRERRRLMSTLLALGTPRRTLSWSMLCQLTVPLAVGMALSTVIGVGLGWVLQRLVGEPLLVNWTVIGLSTGLAVVAVLLVNAVSLPSMWRLVRADGLRTE